MQGWGGERGGILLVGRKESMAVGLPQAATPFISRFHKALLSVVERTGNRLISHIAVAL